MAGLRRLLLGFGAVAILMVFAAAADAGTLTAMCTSGGQTAECAAQWYTSPVTVAWQASPSPVAGTSGCSLDLQYHYTVDQVGKLSCGASWADGNQTTRTYPFFLETSQPTASASPSRPPDDNNWYNHPVAIAFQGGAFSGLAWCTAVQTYSGPDTAGTTITGGCQDNAGKTASAGVSFRYDATPPALSFTAVPADHGAILQWQATTSLAPLTSLQVARAPGLRGAASSVLSPTGAAGSYAQWRLRNRRSYRYTVTAADQAGNTTVQSVVVSPGRRLLAPASGARVTAPPMLSWTAVQKATYYNVQVFRGRKKVLSAWPKQAHLQMGPTWTWHGRRYRLRQGRYRWFVWPGFGRQSAARYRSQIGAGMFIVR